MNFLSYEACNLFPDFFNFYKKRKNQQLNNDFIKQIHIIKKKKEGEGR